MYLIFKSEELSLNLVFKIPKRINSNSLLKACQNIFNINMLLIAEKNFKYNDDIVPFENLVTILLNPKYIKNIDKNLFYQLRPYSYVTERYNKLYNLSIIKDIVD